MINIKTESCGIVLSPGCMNNCIFCGIPQKVSLENIKRIDNIVKNKLLKDIDEYARQGYRIIDISGGDPGEYPNLFRLVEHLKKKGFTKIQLSTHGRTLSDRAFVEALVQAGLTNVRLPLYGSNQRIHDLITKSDGSFNDTMQGIRYLKKTKKVKLLISSLVFHQNKDDLLNIADLFHFLKPEQSNFSMACITNKEVLDDYVPYKDIGKYFIPLFSYIEKRKLNTQILDVPYCIFGKESDRIENRSSIPTNMGKYSQPPKVFNSGIQNLPIYRIKKKTVICSKCDLTENCDGFFANDIDRFGTGDVEPINYRNKQVSIKKCKDYAEVKSAIRSSIEKLGGLTKFIKSGQKVLIKPNICDPLPAEKAATTHPLVVKAVIELVREITPFVDVGEQAAGNDVNITKKALEISGVGKVLRGTNTKFRDLQNEEFIAKDIKNYEVLERTDFSKALFEYDCIINLPKFKTHQLTYITGAVKNCFGLVHPDERQYLHKEFSEKEDFSKGIVDVFSYVKPRIVLNIMDLVVSMDGNEGPSYGRPINTGYVVVGADAVAVDAVASKLTGHNPMAILTIKYANQRGLGVGEISKIKLVGDDIKIKNSFEQNILYRNRNKNLTMQPIISNNCKKCGACFRNCPVKAIELVEGNYVIDREKCIRCYCCLEVCVHEAIEMWTNETKVANLRLGLSCNQDCLFCTTGLDTDSTLSTVEAKKKIDKLKSMDVDGIFITGGEPTIRNDLLDIVIYAKNLNITEIGLQTNGVNLADNKYLKELVANGMTQVMVSLHSHDKEVSNKLTKSNNFKETIEALKNIAATNVKCSVSHVINKENYKDLINFVRYISQISTKFSFYFGFIRPNGNTGKHKYLVPKLCDIEVYISKVMKYCRKMGLHFSIEGIPLCYLSGFEKQSEEAQRKQRIAQIYMSGSEEGHDDLHRDINEKLKAKSKECRICTLNHVCPGVWKEYAEMHGVDELYPVFHKVLTW
ncbi:MAG: DUF362 domain-containing protein [Nanoarchaeota archaeon]|nr:DUF362 domain-containing protein [Nanoarchaeota archaeon]